MELHKVWYWQFSVVQGFVHKGLLSCKFSKGFTMGSLLMCCIAAAEAQLEL